MMLLYSRNLFDKDSFETIMSMQIIREEKFGFCIHCFMYIWEITAIAWIVW